MKDKNYDNYNFDFGPQEYKDGAKYPLSKFDFDLYDEAKAKPGTLVRVKRLGSSTKNERWRIFEDDELKFVIDGEKLTKKERSFLRTVDGVNFLIGEFKIGFKSLHELRGRLKNKNL